MLLVVWVTWVSLMRKSSTSSLWRMRNLSWAAGQGRTRYRSVFSKGGGKHYSPSIYLPAVCVCGFTHRRIEPLQPRHPWYQRQQLRAQLQAHIDHPNNHQTVQTPTNQQTARGWKPISLSKIIPTKLLFVRRNFIHGVKKICHDGRATSPRMLWEQCHFTATAFDWGKVAVCQPPSPNRSHA